MPELTEYEHRGDPFAPFALNAKHDRAQKQAERMRDSVRCPIPPLTWEAYAAGEPCPGCGLPYRDKERWDFRGTMYFNDEERARHEAEEAQFQASHADCGSHRHRVSGSLTMHCGKCCPSPPPSPRQIEQISRLLSRTKHPSEPMLWRLRLYCGHIMERTAHHTHKTLHSAFVGSSRCPECGLDPATIVDGEAIGRAGKPPASVSRAISGPTRELTRAQLTAKIVELEAEIRKSNGHGGGGLLAAAGNDEKKPHAQ